MGPENEQRFFTVENYHGKPNLGVWDDMKCDSVQGATEGVTYHQFISKNDTLKYLRKTMCRVTPLKYKSMSSIFLKQNSVMRLLKFNLTCWFFTSVDEVIKSGMTMYKFVLPRTVYAHPQTDPSLEDCYQNPESTPLLSGLSDVSPCYYGMYLNIFLLSTYVILYCEINN